MRACFCFLSSIRWLAERRFLHHEQASSDSTSSMVLRRSSFFFLRYLIASFVSSLSASVCGSFTSIGFRPSVRTASKIEASRAGFAAGCRSPLLLASAVASRLRLGEISRIKLLTFSLSLVTLACSFGKLAVSRRSAGCQLPLTCPVASWVAG